MSSEIAHVVRDGGGTAAVELTVAGKLREHGHRVTVYGPPEVRDRVERAEFDLHRLDWPAHLPTGAKDLMPRMINSALPWARQLIEQFKDVDAIVADCTAFGALLAAQLVGKPAVSLMPTVCVAADAGRSTDGLRDTWAAARSGINRARTALGLAPVASVTDQPSSCPLGG